MSSNRRVDAANDESICVRVLANSRAIFEYDRCEAPLPLLSDVTNIVCRNPCCPGKSPDPDDQAKRLL